MRVPLDKGRLALLGGSHFANDTYNNSLASLLPFLIPALGLSLPMAGLLVAIYQMTSSVIQPGLGHLADRFGTRAFSILGIAAAAAGASSLGLAPSYLVLLPLAALAGLGGATFHPQSAAMVNSLCLNSGRRGLIMSAYITAGNAGFAVGPLLVVGVVTAWGLRATPLLAAPGLLAALLLILYAPRHWRQEAAQGRRSLRQAMRSQWPTLARLLVVATFRSVTMTALITFLPLLFQGRGYDPSIWAGLLTIFLLAGAAGGLVGGYLSDLLGRRPVIASSLFLSTPLALALLQTEGPALWVLAGLAGAAVLTSNSILIVKTQEVLPENVGMASGLMLGFSIGVGGLGIGPAAFLAERLGIFDTLNLLAFLPLVAALVALTVADQPRPRAERRSP